MPIVLRIARPHYESDVTRFLETLKAARPELEKKQQEGRLIYWDKGPIDLDASARAQAARVP
ncbi:MAG: DUF3460 family protein, partial [Betaproteobacteria bacterium]|nr:DUF3460 family protein [Betaproteobacteria bacterium]